MIARLIISPSLEARVGKINQVLSSEKLTPNHPDLLYFPNDSKLGIEQARQIKAHFSLKPYSAKGRAVVAEDASNLTDEAQNALLKTLEEPPGQALLILAAPSDSKFLPTILSRCQIITLQPPLQPRGLQAKVEKDYTSDVEKLLISGIGERFEYVEKLKDRGEFLYYMVAYFRNKLIHLSSDHGKNVQINQLRRFLKELVQAEEWAEANVNIRAILEYLMLVMPKNL